VTFSIEERTASIGCDWLEMLTKSGSIKMEKGVNVTSDHSEWRPGTGDPDWSRGGQRAKSHPNPLGQSSSADFVIKKEFGGSQTGK
jgi:hypothetical protein